MSSRLLVSGLSIALALSLTGCTGMPDEDLSDEEIGVARVEIKGGYTDETDKAVVGILAFFGPQSGGTCTGSLIAPNVVLTARHCVSEIVNGNNGILCSQTGFLPPEDPGNFFVTTQTTMPFEPADFGHTVREVLLLPVDNLLCGQDQAILILNDNIDPSEAIPLVPRVDEPLVAGEEYYAVGYGAVNDIGTGAETRRRRDVLFVDCVAEECPAFAVKPTEWTGDTGICQGDSGGPALDLKNRVTGVTSRGTIGCENPIYGYVFGWAQWIKDSVLHGAQLGGYPAPAWATGYPTDPVFSAPVGDACEVAETCASGICLAGYCTRPCTDIAACPDGYSCKGEGPVCHKDPKKKDADDEDGGGGISCGVSPPGMDPTKPIPWIVGAGLGALALLRRRRRRG